MNFLSLRIVSAFLSIVMVFITVLSSAEVMGFREWKTQKVSLSKQSLKQLVATETATRFQLKQAQEGLKTAKSLNIHDYFILYLSGQKDRRQAFQQVAPKLTSEEMAELLLAYSRLLQ